MAVARKPRYVDVTNPSLSVECPHCGLLTARFIDHCRNCGYKLWPSSVMAAAAFKVWRDADPSRAMASRFDLEVPVEPLDATIDYAARAHELGIHLFPNSNYPFIICVGAHFLALAAIPFSNIARLVLACHRTLVRGTNLVVPTLFIIHRHPAPSTALAVGAAWGLAGVPPPEPLRPSRGLQQHARRVMRRSNNVHPRSWRRRHPITY